MFLSPNITIIVQPNIQTGVNLNVLSLGGSQANNQNAASSAGVGNLGMLAF